jgi:hypothetical protein
MVSVIPSKADSASLHPGSVQSNHNFIDQFLSKKSQSIYQHSDAADQKEDRPCQISAARKSKARAAPPQLDQADQQLLLEMLIHSYKMNKANHNSEIPTNSSNKENAGRVTRKSKS